MYFVEEGECHVSVSHSGNEKKIQVQVCKRGDYFGELALVTRKPRAASVRAQGRD